MSNRATLVVASIKGSMTLYSLMSTPLQIRVLPQVAYDAALLRADVAQRLGVAPEQVRAIRPLKRSIDARQRQVMVNLTLEVFIDDGRPYEGFAQGVRWVKK